MGDAELCLHLNTTEEVAQHLNASHKSTVIKTLVLSKITAMGLGVAVHTCHPNTWDAEGERSQVSGQRGLHSEFKPSLNYIVRWSQKTEQANKQTKKKEKKTTDSNCHRY